MRGGDRLQLRRVLSSVVGLVVVATIGCAAPVRDSSAQCLGGRRCSTTASTEGDDATGTSKDSVELPTGKYATPNTSTSAPTGDGTPANPTPAGDAGTAPAVDAGSPVTVPDAGTTPTPVTTTACSSRTTRASCEQCCEEANPEGTRQFWNTAGLCACESPAACAVSCGDNWCIGGPPTANCMSCLEASGCIDVAYRTCNGSASCTALLQCVNSSGCENKN